MRLTTGIRNALIVLVLATMLIVPALAMSAEAQPYSSQYSQIGTGIGTGIHSSTQYPYTGNTYAGNIYGQQCPLDYYWDSRYQQCLPLQQQYAYGGYGGSSAASSASASAGGVRYY